uniref:Uncharacterized protein n=1 Tax=Anguilla anguilla TaxID=7936 RepID=A0A0E9PEF9_ANGAN
MISLILENCSFSCLTTQLRGAFQEKYQEAGSILEGKVLF